MADIYVRSTDGNNADSGATWALAKATLAGAAAIDAAGDNIWLSQSHAESTAGSVSFTFEGTRASPSKIVAANDGAEPPTAVATASITTTGVSTISIALPANGSAYFYGITWNIGSGANTGVLGLTIGGTAEIVFESCDFIIVATGASSQISLNVTTASPICTWRNCRIKFGATGQNIQITGNGAYQLHWQGGSVISGSSTPSSTNAIFSSGGTGSGSILVENVDFSNFSSGVHIHNGLSSGANGLLSFVIRNCQLPASWSGSLVRQAIVGTTRYSLYNCSAGSQNYKLWIECAEGNIRDETTLVRTNGATDGTTPISWKLTASSTNVFPTNYLVTDDIAFYNDDDSGTTKNVIIHILHDSATNLTDADIWIDVEYLGSSSTPLASLISDRTADPLTTAVDQDASLAVWTTTGLTNPNKQQLSVSIAPQMKGFILLRVCLAKASKVVYVCPKFEVV